MPIASLTKIWTALVAIENSELDEMVLISKKAAHAEGSSVYLEEGSLVTVETLLHGLLLRSGNDAAMALAEYVGGSEEGFVYLMNERARLAGLTHTFFMNPSGLHHDKHLSTAYDTAKMLQIAMQNPTFNKIASTKSYTSKIVWQNKHKLLFQNTGAIAGKTGYTKVAGRTLATYFDVDKKQFIVVTLNEANDWNRHNELAKLVNETYKWKTVIRKGTYKTAGTKIVVKKPVKLLVSKKEAELLTHTLFLSKNRLTNKGIWQVKLENVPIYQFKVEIREK